jgi:hypothetical protein
MPSFECQFCYPNLKTRLVWSLDNFCKYNPKCLQISRHVLKDLTPSWYGNHYHWIKWMVHIHFSKPQFNKWIFFHYFSILGWIFCNWKLRIFLAWSHISMIMKKILKFSYMLFVWKINNEIDGILTFDHI